MPVGGSFTDIFGGGNIYPSQPSYLLLNPLTVSVQLGWPIEQAPAGSTVVADIIDVNATAGGLTIQFSDATQVSEGYTALFNNIGANSINILNDSGGVIATVASGAVWQLYLADNTTANGTWRAFQFGVGVSQATAAALAGAGLLAIGTTLNENVVIQPKGANYVAINNDRATCLEWTGGAGTLTLPVNPTVAAGWFVLAKNLGTGNWTISVSGGAQIDGAASLVLSPGQSCILIFDGTNYVTLGLGQAATSTFNFVAISLTGQASPFVLAGANLNRISYRFTGVLTANMVIQVPNTIQQYWVDNETTGAFTLTVKTAAGTGIVVPQSGSEILYCDGTNVVNAVSAAGITLPLAVASGGTGATTAGQALINLGGGTTGILVFEAANPATAAAALGLPVITSKPADTTRTATGVTADPDLSGIPLVAGGIYEVEVSLGVLSVASNTNGFTFGMTYSGGSFQPLSFNWVTGAGTANGNIGSNTNVGIALNNAIYARFIFTAIAGGNLSFQWAQSTNPGVGGQTVSKGSYVSVQRIL